MPSTVGTTKSGGLEHVSSGGLALRIDVHSLTGEGRSVRADRSDAWANRAAAAALEANPTTVAAELSLRSVGGVVFVTGTVEAGAVRECDRCGEPVELSVSSDVDLAYASAESSHAQVELTSGDLDLGWFEDGVLALEDVLSEAIALDLPSRVLCADTSACDARTRALLASPPEAQGHPGFAALRGLVPNQEL